MVIPKRSKKLRQAAEARRLSVERQRVSDSRECASPSAEPECTVVPVTGLSSS